MKNILFTSLALFCCIFTGVAQVNVENRQAYEELLQENVSLFNKAVGKEENQKVLRRFERLSANAQGEWLPIYYTALTKLYLLKDAEDKQEFLDGAIEDLEKARKLQNNSEILTLLSRAYIHKVEANPSNGKKYSPLIRKNLDEALKLDSKNPRTFFMYGIFYLNFPSFAGGDTEKGKKAIRKAAELYEEEAGKVENQNNVLPHWGKSWNSKYLKAIEG